MSRAAVLLSCAIEYMAAVYASSTETMKVCKKNVFITYCIHVHVRTLFSSYNIFHLVPPCWLQQTIFNYTQTQVTKYCILKQVRSYIHMMGW